MSFEFAALTGAWLIALGVAAYLRFNTAAGAKAYVKGQAAVNEIRRRVVGE